MKTLLLIRHAKSSWTTDAASDFDRPLNERGHANAPLMANKILANNIVIDAIVSSTANRAITTAIYFAQAYNIATANIIQLPQLYHASPQVLLQTVQMLPNQYQHVAIFSHNNGLTNFANQLCKTTIDNIPTTGIFAITANIDSWQQFQLHQNQFLFFNAPKIQP